MNKGELNHHSKTLFVVAVISLMTLAAVMTMPIVGVYDQYSSFVPFAGEPPQVSNNTTTPTNPSNSTTSDTAPLLQQQQHLVPFHDIRYLELGNVEPVLTY